MAENFEETLVDTVRSVEDQSRRRKAMLLQNGVAAEHAEFIDKLFQEAVIEVARAIGRSIDKVPIDLWTVGIPYILRGLTINVESIEDTIATELIEAIVANGGVVVVAGGNPECMCEICVATRKANAKALNPTRH